MRIDIDDRAAAGMARVRVVGRRTAVEAARRECDLAALEFEVRAFCVCFSVFFCAHAL